MKRKFAYLNVMENTQHEWGHINISGRGREKKDRDRKHGPEVLLLLGLRVGVGAKVSQVCSFW